MNTTESKQIGGWLILVAIGLVISPFRLLLESIETFKPLFQPGVWGALATYNPLLAYFCVLEIIGNTVIGCAILYTIYLFFTKNKHFPISYILVTIVHLVWVLLDAVIASKIDPSIESFDKDTMQTLIKSALSACIWVPYMLVSTRVKETFTLSRLTIVEGDKPNALAP